MNDAVLQNFRQIAETMIGTTDTSWAVCIRREVGGRTYDEVKVFGYTQAMAERAAKCYRGGFAAKTNSVLISRRAQ